ncbi:tetratricopeptide repeat protein [Planctomycetota bacterium]
MTGEAMRAWMGSKSPLRVGFLLVLTLGILSGCVREPQKVDRSALNTLPDKESYLLGKLDVRFESPDVLCELGRYYHEEGRWDKAQYYYSTALGFDPAHRRSQAGQVKMYVDKGDIAQAEQLVQRYQRQLWNTPTEMVDLASALADEKLETYALDCFTKALQVAPHSADTNKQLGIYYLNRGDNQQAREYLTRSFEINPNQPEVAGALGRLGVIVEVPTYQVQTKDEPAPVPGT